MDASLTDKEINMLGTGFFGTLFLVFLVLKLLHLINWSWWFVTSPLWLPMLITAIIMMCVAILAELF